MLEKLAEMVREQADEVGLTTNQLCFMCEHSQEECLHNNKATCINANTPNGSFRIARWAVLLVAEGLEKECKGYQGETAKDAFVRDTAIMLLITEAKEGTNDAV